MNLVLGNGVDPAILGALVHQRNLVGEVAQEIEVARRDSTSVPVDTAPWNSMAQRAYSDRAGEVQTQLALAQVLVDQALQATEAAISAIRGVT